MAKPSALPLSPLPFPLPLFPFPLAWSRRTIPTPTHRNVANISPSALFGRDVVFFDPLRGGRWQAEEDVLEVVPGLGEALVVD